MMLGSCQDPRVGRGLCMPGPTPVPSSTRIALLCSHVLSGLCPYTHPLALGVKTPGHMVSPVLAQIRKMKLGEVIICWYSTWDFKLR